MTRCAAAGGAPLPGPSRQSKPAPRQQHPQQKVHTGTHDEETGETMSANDARRIYEEIVRRQRDPALVEWMGYGLLRARIFPINPGEEKRRRSQRGRQDKRRFGPRREFERALEPGETARKILPRQPPGHT